MFIVTAVFFLPPVLHAMFTVVKFHVVIILFLKKVKVAHTRLLSVEFRS